MKNTYFTFLFLFIFTLCIQSVHISAQQVQRTVVAELFTNTRCGICANRVPGFKTQLEQYGDQVVLLSFFSAAPFPNCELHQEAKPINDARVGYYNVSGSPVLHLNGERAPTTVWNNVSGSLDPLINQTTELELISYLSTDGNQFSADIEIIQHEAFEPYQETVLQVFVIEKNVTAGNLSNYMEHNNVVRKQLTQSTGLVYQADAGMNQLFNFDFEPLAFWNENELAVVAFLQGADGTIYNASLGEITVSSSTQMDRRPTYQVFPNPTTNYVIITSENTHPKTVALYNLLGSAIYTENFKQREKKIYLQEIPQGLYLLRISSPGLPDRTLRLVIER